MTTVTHDMTIMDTPLKELKLSDISDEVSLSLRLYPDHISLSSTHTTPLSFRYPDLPSDGQKLINRLIYILSEMATYREAGYAVYDGYMVIESGNTLLSDNLINNPFSKDKQYTALNSNVYDGTRLFLYVDGEYVPTTLIFASRGVRAIPMIYIDQIMAIMREHYQINKAPHHIKPVKSSVVSPAFDPVLA